MANDLIVQTGVAVRVGNDTAGALKQASADAVPMMEHSATSSPVPNPTLRLNAQLGLVVIEFRNDAGTVTSSIPSQRQMEAYQRWTQTHTSRAPKSAAAQSGQATNAAPAPAEHKPIPAEPVHHDTDKGSDHSTAD